MRGATSSSIRPRASDNYFNPRAPCGARLFLPAASASPPFYFNPRAPCGARRKTNAIRGRIKFISIHAPHAGRDTTVLRFASISVNFNPRAPCGARLVLYRVLCLRHLISIHAPHAGRDGRSCPRPGGSSNFNPRAPCGARQQKCTIYVLHFCNNRHSKQKSQHETSSVRTFF